MDKLIALFFLLLKEWPMTLAGAIVTVLALYGFFSLLKKFLERFLEKFLKQLLAEKEELKQHIKKIETALSNHVTGTDKKIDKLADGQIKLERGQANLEVKITEGQAKVAEGQAELAVKIAEGQAELYKHLGIKNKKQ